MMGTSNAGQCQGSSAKCIDLGSDRCPCHLAYTKDCIYCTMLQRGRIALECKCNWQGVCVLNQFNQDKGLISKGKGEIPADIVKTKNYGPDLKVIDLKVEKGYAIKAMRAGSYLFARPWKAEERFKTPISILKTHVEEGMIQLAICLTGPKTQLIFEENERLLINGIYSNGVVGVRRLERTLMNVERTNVRVNIFAKGVAVSPLINILDIIKEYPNYKIYLDDEKLSGDFVIDYLGQLPVSNVENVSFPGDLNALLTVAISENDGHRPLNMALASPYYIEQFLSADSQLVYSNNTNLCCGEGICGSCTYTDKSGKVHRRCKEWV